MAEKFLVTGALGCIGAWTVKRLVAEGVPVWTYDLPGEPHRLRLIMDDAALAKVNFIHGDITDAAAFEQAVAANGITHVVHLAALQVPFVRADPLAGARVNVVGTAEGGTANGSVPESSSETIAYSNSTASAMDEIAKMLASQAAMTAGLEVKLETINLVSVEEPEIPAPNGAATPEPAKPAATK